MDNFGGDHAKKQLLTVNLLTPEKKEGVSRAQPRQASRRI